MPGVAQAPTGLPPMTRCQVINHTPAGYALRQIDPKPTALRIGDLIALRVEGRTGLQVAMVRWFRNTLKGSGLEFGCELLSDSPEAAAAAAEDAADGKASRRSLCCPRTAARRGRRLAAAGRSSPPAPSSVDQGDRAQARQRHGLRRAAKLVEQGPGFELYDFAPVG